MRTTLATLALLFSAFTTSSLFAAEWPEPRPIAAAELSPAAYRQDRPDAAWTGEHFLAVWEDHRKTAFWSFGTLPAIYASRVSSEGATLDPLGIHLVPRGTNPRIASNERGSLMTYSDGNATSFAVPLGDRGPSGPHVSLGSLDVSDLATNGVTYCAVASRWPGTNKALILNARGHVLQSIDIEGKPTAVAAVNGVYIVISSRGSDVLATAVVANRPTRSQVIASVGGEVTAVALAGDDRVLVAYRTMADNRRFYEYVLVGADAAPIGEPHRFFDSAEFQFDSSDEPALGWDGELFLIGWQTSDDRQFALRVRRNGSPLGEIELDTRMKTFASAYSGNVALLVSVEPVRYTTDLYARAIPSFRMLPVLPAPKTLAFSARPQMQPAVAYAGDVAMAVAIEGEGPEAVVATLFDPRNARPSVTQSLAARDEQVQREGVSAAVTRSLFMVAWREMSNHSTQIVAQRVDASGMPLPGRTVIASEPLFVYFGETSVATDGDSFFIVWDSPSKEILARRIGADGTLLDSAPLVISRNPDKTLRDLGHPEVIWTGSEYLVAWSEHEQYTSAPPAGMTRIRGARVTRDGTLIDAGDSKTFFERPGHPTGVDLAINETGLLVVGAFSSTIGPLQKFVDALPLDRAANPTAGAPIRLDLDPIGARLTSPAAAGIGKAFYVFWGEEYGYGISGSVRGVYLENDTVTERFDVANTTAYSPAATSFDRTVVLVQSQLDHARSNVMRLFASTLSPDEPAVLKRQRVVRP